MIKRLVVAGAVAVTAATFTSAPARAWLFPAGTGPLATIGTLPRVLVGSSPQDAVFDPATRTVYVANAGDNTVSVVNAGTCNARDTTGCAQVPATVPVGANPSAMAIDQTTHTLYVTDALAGEISVINAAACNATDTSGCGHVLATMTAGPGPIGMTLDPATGTIYATDLGTNLDGSGDTVSVIDAAACSALDTSGCGQAPATVTVGRAPISAAFDAASQTVYVTNQMSHSLSMINARTCRAGHTAGCRRKPRSVRVGSMPTPVAVDAGTGTVYVGNNGDATVSVINGATCNAASTTGCVPSALLRVPGGPDGLAVDAATRTLFVSDNSTASGGLGPGHSPARADSVSVIDAATCNAEITAGCRQRAPIALTGAAPGPGAVDTATGTLYVPTGDNALTIVNEATCNASMRTGCGQPVPATMAGPDPFTVAANPATNTLYVANFGDQTISLINEATCNTETMSGCRARPAAITMPGDPYGLAVDQATDTIYATTISTASGKPGTTVSVIDGATCNASHTAGCGRPLAAVTVGTSPAGLAVDQATGTIYVANSGGTTVSVINGKTCNAGVTSGCRRQPHRVRVQNAAWAIAVDQATNTIYALSPGSPGTVSVINGATCNASVTTGCSQTPPTVTVGSGNPLAGLAVNPATDTIYAVNTIDNTVSVINGATCNRKVPSGCRQRPAHVNVGRQGSGFAAVDSATDRVYVTNYLDDTISVINGATCNGHIAIGCHQRTATVPAGANPAGLAVDPASHTVYVADNTAGTVSFFRFQIPARPTGVTLTARHGTAELRWRPVPAGGLPVIYQVITSPACPACRGLTTPSTSGEPFAIITGLTPGQQYTFKVEATDAAGTGPKSAPTRS